MPKVFNIELLPARHGDCIWIDYGEKASLRHILIDGGPLVAYPALRDRIEGLPAGDRRLELLVISHIDGDHIEGIVKLLNQNPPLARFRDIWFNGWPQLDRRLTGTRRQTPAPTERERGPRQGEYLGLELSSRKEHWNRHFDGEAIFVPDEGELPRVQLNGGLVITLLSPTAAKLKSLRKTWLAAVEAFGVMPGDENYFRPEFEKDKRYRGRGAAIVPDTIASAAMIAPQLDNSVANGSSIAFEVSYGGRRCLFLADAHMRPVENAISRLAGERGEARLRVDAVKLAHHGSAANISSQFLEQLDCHTFLVSTDGSHFDHPDDAAIEKVVELARPARLLFNYRSERNVRWADRALQRELGFTAVYPVSAAGGLSLDLFSGSEAHSE